jgi:hypothetical protein
MPGVNAELAPLLRMSWPRRLGDGSLEGSATGQPLFTSCFLLFGILPVDLYRVRFEEISPGAGFHEGSTSLLFESWVHRRSLRPCAGGCVVEDRIEFVPRFRLLAPVLERVGRRMFAQRHGRLRRLFGGARARLP